VLASVAEKRARLFARGGLSADALRRLEVLKLDGDAPPDGVRALATYGADRLAKSQEIEELLSRDLLVVGGTQGGLYNLMRARARGDTEALWDFAPFDLLVLDEASQMSGPEALLASAFLRPGGQTIVVGDHRQMPPILSHDWQDEEKRSLQEAQPYRSIFELLLDRGFPCVALDQSFRLHRVQAEFLSRQVYARDGIPFHSTREELLPAAHYDDPFVAASLDPAYPVVVVEHGERESQQSNELEAELAARLVRACLEVLRLGPEDGLGVVVPHRAQKAALARRFPQLAAASAVDTVERFQGGERDVIVLSATASDPGYVLREAEFLLNPNRFTVAVSRPRKKLVVLAASSVLRLVPSDLELFEHASLWKRLRFQEASRPLWSGQISGVPVAVHGRHAVHPAP
jgi:superfamily I DNA and/or RNA helicase